MSTHDERRTLTQAQNKENKENSEHGQQSGHDENVDKITVTFPVEMDTITCSICKETMIEPMSLICRHSFCKTCIDRNDIKYCPLCRQPKLMSIGTNLLLKDLVIHVMGLKAYETGVMQKKQSREDEVFETKIRQQCRDEMYHEILTSVQSRHVNPIAFNPGFYDPPANNRSITALDATFPPPQRYDDYAHDNQTSNQTSRRLSAIANIGFTVTVTSVVLFAGFRFFFWKFH